VLLVTAAVAAAARGGRAHRQPRGRRLARVRCGHSPTSLPRSMRASRTSGTNRSAWPRRASTMGYFVPSSTRKCR